MFIVLKFILTILLLPVCVISTMSFYQGIVSIKTISQSGMFFILGALFYSIIHIILFKLDFLYVFGHESMHAIAAVASGGKVKGMKVSSKEGSVKATKANSLIMLAPYLIPIYTVIVAILYFISSFFVDVIVYSKVFVFLIGFTLMMHLSYTAESIKDKQSDLIKTGYLLSISLVYLSNLAIVFLITSFLFSEVSFIDFIIGIFEKSKGFYYSIWRQLFL
jgi:hypothetical protein